MPPKARGHRIESPTQAVVSSMQNVTDKTPMAAPRIQPPTPDEHRHHHFGLAFIAVFKLVKGLLLLTAAIGLLRMVHAGVSATVEHWITVLRMDPDSRYFHWLLVQLGAISPQQFRAVSAGSFFYSAL